MAVGNNQLAVVFVPKQQERGELFVPDDFRPIFFHMNIADAEQDSPDALKMSFAGNFETLARSNSLAAFFAACEPKVRLRYDAAVG